MYVFHMYDIHITLQNITLSTVLRDQYIYLTCQKYDFLKDKQRFKRWLQKHGKPTHAKEKDSCTIFPHFHWWLVTAATELNKKDGKRNMHVIGGAAIAFFASQPETSDSDVSELFFREVRGGICFGVNK
ncbi:hypothetical protein CEXT_788471 [Caerostris extrusa]|uniref:Uncharacterized protein n=1 Tax=Caerostris extrusa TaxID=172846 RepID=A0AAV4N7G6_CAEEX|nr:hypothetical protein CEXT_788471 [Caerostris extrusa]